MLPLLQRALLLATVFGAALAMPPRAAAGELDPFAAREASAPATDRVIVKLRETGAAGPGSTKPAPGQLAERMSEVGLRAGLRLRSIRSLGAGMQVVALERAAPGESLQATLARLRADAAVEFAEPDARMRPHRLPNDPGFAEQWFLQAPVPGLNGTTASAIDAVAAWDVTLGSPAVVVAVIDTGVRFDHPDLGRAGTGGKLLPGYDFVSGESGGTARAANDGDGWDPDAADPGDWISSQDRQISQFASCFIDDSSWHGTRVSGMVAGLTDNATGVSGVAWDGRLLPVRVLGKCGGLTSDIIAGMRWAAGLGQQDAPVNPNPARVLNLSLGGEGACSRSYQAAIDEITARGVVVVVSAGNDGSLVDQPANCRGVVSVTGIRHVGTKVGFANLGPDVTIAAPGGNCVNVGLGEPCLYSLDTTTNLGVTTPGANAYTERIGNFNVGTSFAAPIVAGVAALMYSVNSSLRADTLVQRLQASARPFPVSSDPSIPTCRIPAGSFDEQLSECSCTTSTCGAGMIDAPGAVAAALRPIAVVATPSTASAGQTVSLSGADSVGADGRTIAAYAWTLVSGATSLAALSGSQTSFVAPGTSGDVVVRLSVTDDLGRTDSTDATVRVTGGSQPPPPGSGSGGGGGGGGRMDLLALFLAASLSALARRPNATPERQLERYRA